MLTVKDLTELENYITSGELEADFKDGCENDRFYLLELLEKLMDVSELADAAARLNVNQTTIRNRLKRGWSVERTLATPPRRTRIATSA